MKAKNGVIAFSSVSSQSSYMLAMMTYMFLGQAIVELLN